MDEFRYDNAGENAKRLPLLLATVGGMCVTGWALLTTNALMIGGFSLALLLVGPVLLGLYLYDLWRHYRHRDDRIVLEDDGVVVWQAGSPRRIERAELDYAYHTGALLHIKLKNDLPVQVPANFQNQEELIRRLKGDP